MQKDTHLNKLNSEIRRLNS